jgi:hypothetical protein
MEGAARGRTEGILQRQTAEFDRIYGSDGLDPEIGPGATGKIPTSKLPHVIKSWKALSCFFMTKRLLIILATFAAPGTKA